MAQNNRAQWFLKSWRKHRGLTQDKLAQRSGLSKPFISQLETGKRQYSQDVLELLAQTLRCSPPDLLMRDPTDPEGIWTVWESAQPGERVQIVEVAKALTKRTGSNG